MTTAYNHITFSAFIAEHEDKTIWRIVGTCTDNMYIDFMQLVEISLSAFNALDEIEKEDFALSVYYRAMDITHGNFLSNLANGTL